jgi:hypothetical protein
MVAIPRSVGRVGASALGISLYLAASAHAVTKVTGDTTTGVVPGALGNVGTVSVYAFSQQTKVAPLGTNLMVTTTVVKGGVTTHPASSTLNAATNKISVTKPLGPGRGNVTVDYGPPIVALRRQGKPTVNTDMVQIISYSGVFGGSGIAVGPGPNNTPPGGVAAAAFSFATRAAGEEGSAAGEAVDPVLILPGSYDYAPSVDVSIQVDENNTGEVDVYAVDSSVFTGDDLSNFVEDGGPMADTLWTLSLGADAPLASESGVDVGFYLNPAALNEISFPSAYLSSLPGYSLGMTEAELAALLDVQLADAAAGALSFDSGIASLSGYDPFPDGTMFTPEDSEDGVEFADGVDAGVQAVPLPSAAWLGAAGLVLVALSRTRRGAPAH